MTDKTYGQEVRRRRLSAGLTQEQLAVKVGITSVTLSRIEQGRSEPRRTTRDAIERELLRY